MCDLLIRVLILTGAAGLAAHLDAAPPAVARRSTPPAPEIRVAPGFEIIRVHPVAREAEGSWVSVSADAHGRLYASSQYGPLYRLVLPAGPGAAPEVTALPLPIGGIHGMCWVNGSLYAVVGQKAVCPPGLYRLRDTDDDGELDHVEQLKALDGEGEHGPHAVVPGPDGRSLYVLAGNATRLPDLDRSRVPRLWGEDSLLAPLPALMGSETRGVLPGGWICRTDLDGQTWELMAAGLRNAYAMAFAQGELFTFDSDTELELNLPWYRPTRVLHVVSGADFGWRRGALKPPDGAPDIWPPVLPMGLGSPTVVVVPSRANLPAAYRKALWVADWSYGKLYALQLQPGGGSYTASREEIVSGTPLPITGLCVNPIDGAIYFTTGGRRLQSALYRLRWNAAVPAGDDSPPAPTEEAVARHRLETFHGRKDSTAVAVAWPALASTDGSVRSAARTALESQPVDSWRSRALEERAPRAALAALLALARADARASQRGILMALRELHDAGLDHSLRAEWLRVLSLTFSRAGGASKAVRARWVPVLERLFPTGEHELDAPLLELLVFCEARDAATKGVAALRAAVTRQAQLDFAKSLRDLRTGWTPAGREEFFNWLAETTAWRGGGSFARFLQRLRDDALAAAPESERGRLRDLLAAAAADAGPPDYAATAGRSFVRAWTTDDLTMLAEKDTRKRDRARGRKLFGAVGCFACHTFNGEGGAFGPDLTGVSRRMGLRDLLEAIVEPSREISDQYDTVLVRLRDGRQLSGRIVNLTPRGLQLAQNLADPSDVVRFAEDDVVAIEPSQQSLMPPGLLDVLAEDEILDVLAFIRSSGTR